MPSITVSSRPGLTGKTIPLRSNEQYRKPNQVYTKILQFLDHLIPYETFLNDLSSRIVRQLKADKDDPEFISQRKAYELFGRRNVERWKRQGKVVSYKRPGKVEYRTADLRLLQRTTQDYFDESQSKQTERPVKKDK